MVTLGKITGWQPPAGSVTTWMASPAAREAAQHARRSDLPPSYQRARHLRAAYDGNAAGRQLPRLMVVAWDIPGVCDVAAMTATINAHVRRHDTYHDAFEFADEIVIRRTIDEPDVIDFAPREFGYLTPEEIREHALTTTPGTLEWDCFTFGIVQHADYFSFYASVDHLHIDGMSAGLIFFDIQSTYQAIANGVAVPAIFPQTASYRGYAHRQRDNLARLTLASPEVEAWLEFARDTAGEWPSFPLPLRASESDTAGDFLTVDLLDATQTESFDTACRAAGARFSGGVLACAALTEHELTGDDTFHGFTPYDTRTPALDSMTVGWFASLIPVTVPTVAGSFPEAARAAQESFDGAKHLAAVPLDRAIELADPQGRWIEPPTARAMMVSFIDFRAVPAADLLDQYNFGTYADNLSHGGINLWINRHADKTTATISFPDNTEARASVQHYLEALARSFARAVKTTSDWVDAVAAHANCGHRAAINA
ncbi:condensation domain-containing protein [Mycobacterium colombiense]|uniref:condensation domain-containing protein n=1 Tax=Mycobacterium colombiense TaxID=339268 RepID=UPI0007FE4F73|nr:condensation domain-containing protein [Mycobacterium colombiense]OBJ77955.1 acyltransferase [Mycobacterium colombiense]